MVVESSLLHLACILLLTVVSADDVTISLCAPNSGSRKLECSEANKLVQFTTRDGEDFESVAKLIQRPGDVKQLWLNGVKFQSGLITTRTFVKFTALSSFVCASCSITRIENNAFKMQSDTLTHLELTGNKNLENFDEQSLPALRLLKISSCKLSKFPNVGSSSVLQEMFLDASVAFTDLNGEELSAYKYLKKLSISGMNQLKSIEKARMDKLPKSLRMVSITGSAIERIEAGAFETLSALETLNLGYNQLDEVALKNALTGLTSIKQLSVAGSSKLTTLPNSTFVPIRQRVEQIDISRCPLETLADGLFAAMPQLSIVKMRALRITAIKKGVFGQSISLLTYLDVSNNSLHINDVDLTQLQRLTYLDLSNNKHLFESGTIGLHHFSTLTALRTLRLSNCSIAGIDNLEKLRDLSELDLSFNQLVSFPSAICTNLPSFMSIKTLDLSNQTKTTSSFKLPGTACSNLRDLNALKLQGLNIDTQALLDASAFWTSLQAITELDLSDNPLKDLLESKDKESNFGKFLALFSKSNKINKLSIQRSSIAGVLELESVCIALPNIRFLLLNGNRLKAVRSSESTAATCPSLNQIGLQDNELSKLESSTITQMCSMPSLNQLDLLGNSFDCDCELAAFWNAVLLNAYSVGSQRWAFIGSVLKPSKSMTQKCKIDGVDISLIEFGNTQCDGMKSRVETWRPCVEKKKKNNVFLKSAQVSGDMTDIPDDEFLMSHEPSSQTSNAASKTGVVLGSLAALGVAGAVGAFVYKRRRSGNRRKVSNLRCKKRRDHQMQVLHSSDSSQETLSVDEPRIQSPFPSYFESLPESSVINPGQKSTSTPRSSPQSVTLHSPTSSPPQSVAEVHPQPQITVTTNDTNSHLLIPPGMPATTERLVDIDLSGDADDNTHIKVPEDSSSMSEYDEFGKQTTVKSENDRDDDLFN